MPHQVSRGQITKADMGIEKEGWEKACNMPVASFEIVARAVLIRRGGRGVAIQGLGWGGGNPGGVNEMISFVEILQVPECRLLGEGDFPNKGVCSEEG